MFDCAERSRVATVLDQMVNLYFSWWKVRPSVALDLPPTQCVDLLSSLGFSSYSIERLWEQYRASDLRTYFSSFKEMKIGAPELIKVAVDEGADFTERMAELCQLFGIELTYEELLFELYRYALFGLNGGVIDQLKYSTNLFFCIYYRVAFPIKQLHYLGLRFFPRRLVVWLGRNRSKRNMKVQQLVYTIFQGFKKGLLPVRVEKVFKSLQDHCSILRSEFSIPKVEPNKTPASGLDVVRRVGEWFNRKLIEKHDGPLLGNVRSEHSKISRKSTLQYNYGEGSYQLLYDSLYRGRSCPFEIPVLAGYLRVKYEVRPVYCIGPALCELWEELCLYNEFILNDQPHVSPYCILEPMKVRIITKADAWQYPGLKDVQKAWWGVLKNLPTFQIIGDPDVTDVCRDLCQVAAKNPLFGFGSGDYSGATDRMHGDVSELLISTVTAHHDITLQKAVYNALCGSKISYGTKCLPVADGFFGKVTKNIKDHKGPMPKMFKLNEPVDQDNGQLMGSILSFPLLCLANYAAYHWSVETFLCQRFPIMRLPEPYNHVYVNGDDILFCSSPEFYEYWMSQITDFGFIPSVGKNLFSRDVMQINSELFQYIGYHDFASGKSFGTMRKIHYVNFGLLTNRKKQDCSMDTVRVFRTGFQTTAGGWKTEIDLTDLHSRIKVMPKIQSTVLDSLAPALLPAANRLFWKHSQYITKLYPELNVFAPERLGGLGLKDDGLGFLSHPKIYRRPFLKSVYKTDLDQSIKEGMEHFGNLFPKMQTFRGESEPFHNYHIWKRQKSSVDYLILPLEEKEDIKPVKSALGSHKIRWLPR